MPTHSRSQPPCAQSPIAPQISLIVLVADPEQAWRLMSPDALVAMQLSWVLIFFASLG